MKKIFWTVVLLGVVAAASAAAWKWREYRLKNALPAGIVAGNGRIESTQVDIAAKYGGRIKEILAREGDMVEAGQVLVKMDTSELDAELAKDKATLAENEQAAGEVRTEIAKSDSQLKLAEVEYKRSYDLLSRRAIAREEFDRYKTRLDTAKATLDGSNAKLKTAEQSIGAAAAVVKRTEAQLEDAILKSPVRGRVLYRLAEPAEVVALGGKVLTLINLSDIYMEIYLPSQEAARAKIGADARIVLDARPEYAAQAKVSYVSPEAQFTPKQVETRSERDKLMFRVKLQVPSEVILPYLERVKTGVRGMGYVRLDDAVAWPAFLERRFPTPDRG
jgi:HlyD family secretion protein